MLVHVSRVIGDRYVNVLGAKILVTVVPVLLGDGVRLLEPLSVTHTPVVTNAWFRVIRR